MLLSLCPIVEFSQTCGVSEGGGCRMVEQYHLQGKGEVAGGAGARITLTPPKWALVGSSSHS